MKRLISNDEVNKLKLNNDEVEEAVRGRSWLIHHLNVIYTNTVLEKHVSSENIYILILRCQWWSIINLFSNRWTNWSCLRISCTSNIYAERLNTKHNFSKKKALEKGKWTWYCPLLLLSHQSKDCFIEASVLQNVFSSVTKCSS